MRKNSEPDTYVFDASRRNAASNIAHFFGGFANVRMWSYFGARQLKEQYQGAELGVIWIALTMMIQVTAIGFVWSRVFGKPVGEFMPYLALGLLVWNSVSRMVTEGARTYVKAGPTLKQIAVAPTMFSAALMFQHVLHFAIRSLVVIAILVLFDVPFLHGLAWALLGTSLMFLTALGFSVWFGLIGARFRDVVQLTDAAMLFVFFLTPVIWPVDRFASDSLLLLLNPFYYYLNVVRTPLLGDGVPIMSFYVVGALTALNLIVAFVGFALYGRRAVFWV